MAQYVVEYGSIWVGDRVFAEGSVIDLEADMAARIGPQVRPVVSEPAQKPRQQKPSEE